MTNRNKSSSQKTSTNAGTSRRAGQRWVAPVAYRVLRGLSNNSRSQNTGSAMPQSQHTSVQPAAQNQQGQAQGQAQGHVGECALSVTSPSALTSFGNRWAIWAACSNSTRTGDQPRGQHAPECYECAGAAGPILAASKMGPTFNNSPSTRQLPGCHCHGPRQPAIGEYYVRLGCWSRCWSPWCECMRICRSTTYSDRDI